jgi:hypothetical protein
LGKLPPGRRLASPPAELIEQAVTIGGKRQLKANRRMSNDEFRTAEVFTSTFGIHHSTFCGSLLFSNQFADIEIPAKKIGSRQ